MLPVCTDIVHRTGETNTRAVITKNCNPVVAAVLDDGFNEFFVVFFRNGLKLCFRNADIGVFTDFIAGTSFHVLYGQVIVHQDIVLVIFRVQHITPGIDGFNRTVRKCNVEGRTAVIDGIRALAFGNACNIPVKAAGSQNDKNFIGLFGSDFHICPNSVHGIGVKIILRRQFLRFGRVQIDKSAAAGGEGHGKRRRKDKR